MLHRLPSIRPWNAWLASREPALERLDVETEDGVRLAIHYVAPRHPNGEAVMLLHGLASNRFPFHFPGRSLALWLAEQGFACYLPELRGHGESQRPPLNWGIDEYLELDLPRVIAAIRQHSQSERIHAIGHSLGGLLLMCYGILEPLAPIKSAMAIGTALDYRIGYTSFRELLKVRLVLERLPVIPYGLMFHLASPLLGRRTSRPLDALTAWPANIEPEVLRRIQATCFHSVPMTLLRSIAPIFGLRGLHPRDRRLYYLESANRFRIPLRLLGGTKDLQIGVDALHHTAGLVGGPAEVVLCGKEHGHDEDYGHWDLLLGRRAEVEVWPGILAWLERFASIEARQSA